MGEYIKRKYPDKAKYYVLLDWITDLILAAAFIYMSWQIRLHMLQCVCPYCGKLPNITEAGKTAETSAVMQPATNITASIFQIGD